jgi:diacylglycerol kinase family enzyme
VDAIPCLLNPEAGTAQAVSEAIASDGRIRLRECSPHSLREALRAEMRGGVPRIVVAGGDGTIATAAKLLIGTPHELAVIPAGTLNHFARSHGIPTEPAAAAELAASGSARAVDVGFVNDRLFLNTSSVGAYIAFVHARERWEGRLGYWGSSLLAAVRTLVRLPTYAVEVTVEGQVRRYRTPVVFVGVGERELRFPHFGERIGDGRSGLHVIALRGRARARLFVLALAAAVRGLRTVSRTPHLDSFLVESGTIRLPRRDAGYVAIDGETVRLEIPLRYRLERAALQVVVPPPR